MFSVSRSPEAALPKRSIRPHVKVRTGCKTCKKRHIKCDESKPNCNNCVQRSVLCIWKENMGNNQRKRRGKKHTKVRKGVEEVRERAHGSSSLLLKQPTGQLDTITLELVHHYTAYSSSSLCSNVHFTLTCRDTFPKRSFTNLFLWHAMLSSTALHLGHLYSSNDTKRIEWLSRASFHRKISLNLHQTTPTTTANSLPTCITDSDSDTKYIGIGFLTLYTISSALSISPSNIFSLLTTIHNMWSKLTKFMFTDPTLRDMLPISSYSEVVSVPRPLPLHLKRIYVLNDNSIPDSWELKDPEITEAYKSAVDALLYTFYPLSQSGFEIMGAIQWPAFFSKRFCDLLNERKQRALVLLYHYLVILRRIGDQGCWWACDMGSCADYVYGLVNGEWRMWLERGWIDGGGYAELIMEGAVIHQRQWFAHDGSDAN